MLSLIKLFYYRAKVIWRSFRVLYTLTPKKVDAFIESYRIYDFDWKNKQELIDEMGPEYYDIIRNKLVDWYSVINHLCAMGEVEKMYIPPVMDLQASVSQNQILFEKRLSRDLQITPGDNVLDIGCGRGKIAMHISNLTEGNVTGINIDLDQIESAEYFAEYSVPEGKCQFKLWDMNTLPLPFDDNTFDSIYQVQAFSISQDLQKLLNELYRILKPGGRFGCLDWVALPNYDENNEHHRTLMKGVKPLVGAIGTPTSSEYVELLENAGFELLTAKDLSLNRTQAPLITKVDNHFNRVFSFIKILVKMRILPKHFERLLERLTRNGKCFVEADRLGLITTSFYIVARKSIQ